MNTQQRIRAKEVFITVIDVPVVERSRHLDEACGGDAEVRAEVESLLAADALPPLQTGAMGGLGARDGDRMVGQRIGHYVVKSLIGEGGMGVVYLAEQDQPMRDVALKLMRTGLASTSALRRFRDESQTLARLDHHGIAHIFEAGIHDSGSGQIPFFAMEYIAGAQPITDYAREQGLSTRDKLALFAAVCDAVQHGHNKGIIHRDLKPQNILVGSGGVAKVIDFGVARTVASDPAATMVATGVGQLIGTLLYMSPEQLDGDPHDLDTRSDVYALGVVLYELLAGRRPYNIGSATLPGMVKAIWDQPPERLSRHDKKLRGDIETITLKAMHRDRRLRYQTAAELAADVQRFLEGEPILARRTSRRYLVRMFVRKNKTACTSVALAVLGLAAGLILALVSRDRAVVARGEAVVARKQAMEVSNFLVEFLKSTDPSQPEWHREVAVDAMSRAAEDVDAGPLRGQPTHVLRTIADILAGNGRMRQARHLAEYVLQKETTVHTGDHPDVAASLTTLAVTVEAEDGVEASVKLLERALKMNQRLYPEGNEEVALSLGHLSSVLRKLGGRDQEALDLMAKSLQIREQLHPEDLYRLAVTRSGYAYMLQGVKRYDEAEQLYERAHEAFLRLHPGDHHAVAGSLNALAWVRAQRGKSKGAISAAEDGLAMCRRLSNGPSLAVVGSLTQLGGILGYLKQWEAAEGHYQESLHMVRQLTTEDNRQTADCLHNLAVTREQLGRPQEAELLYRDSLAMWRRLHIGDHHSTANTMADLARCLSEIGNHAEAGELAMQAHAMASRILSPEHETRKKCKEVVNQISARDGQTSK